MCIRDRDEDIASELNKLAAIYKQYYDKAEKELSAKTAKAAIDEKNLRDELKKADEDVYKRQVLCEMHSVC